MKPKSILFKRFFSLFFALATLLEPTAQAASYNIDVSEDKVREFIKMSDLDNPNQTVGEFFAKMETQLPERILKTVRPWFLAHSHERMPALDVSKFKDTDGKQKIRLTLTKDSQSIAISLLGEDERMAKVGSVPLVLEDILKFTPMLERLSANMSAARAIKGGVPQVVTRPRGEYVGFFAIPKREAFNKLTPLQRAEIIVRLRMAWNAAQEVKFQANRINGGKRTAENQHEVFHDYFFAALLGHAANAASYFAKDDKNGCIDSGWVGEWNDKNCSSEAKERYTELVKQSSTKCNASFCNPAVYGYDAKGNPICTETPTKRQNATHWEGACDSGSRLSSKKNVEDLEINPNVLYGESGRGEQDKIRNKILGDDREAVTREAQRMLTSMLTKGVAFVDGSVASVEAAKVRALFDGKGDEEAIKAFSQMVAGFYTEINSGLDICSKMNFPDSLLKSKVVKKVNDTTQQLNACRQLWRRKLAFDAGMVDLCPVVRGGPGKGKFDIPAGTCNLIELEPKPPECDKVTEDLVKTNQPDGKIKFECKCKPEFPVLEGNKCVAKKPSCDKRRDEVEGPFDPVSCKCTDNSPLTSLGNGKYKCGKKDDKPVACTKNVISSDFDRKTCLCKDGNEPKKDDKGDWRCGSVTPTPIVRRKDPCEDPSFTKWMSCNSDWLMPLAGLAVVAGTYIYIRKDAKKTQQNPTDLCPGTTQVCPGGVVPNNCKAPLVYNFTTGLCFLSCPPGEYPDYTTNKCVATATVPTCIAGTVVNCMCNGTIVANYDSCVNPTYTCADGSKVANSTLCVTQITCPNGLKVSSPAQCPVVNSKTVEDVQGTIRKIDPGQK